MNQSRSSFGRTVTSRIAEANDDIKFPQVKHQRTQRNFYKPTSPNAKSTNRKANNKMRGSVDINYASPQSREHFLRASLQKNSMLNSKVSPKRKKQKMQVESIKHQMMSRSGRRLFEGRNEESPQRGSINSMSTRKLLPSTWDQD